jgi:cytoskeleton protein RodZ
MTSLSDTLRATRIQRGLEVGEIAEKTKISRYYLEAMENGQFDCLPAGAYRRSFVRQYARVLELNEEEIVARFLQQYDDPEVPLPRPRPEHRHWHGNILWILAPLAAFAGVYRFWQNEIHAPPPVSVTRRPTARHSGEAARVQTAPAEKVVSEPAPAPNPGGIVQVAFSTTEPVWVVVTCDGLQAFSGTLATSERKQFEAASRMTALVGNAGGLGLSLNGKPIGPVGAHGEVKLLEFTAQGAHVIARPRQSPPPNDDTPDP